MMTLEETILQGLSICDGIGIGKLYILRPATEEILNEDIAEGHIEEEVVRYREALQKAKHDIHLLQEQMCDESIPEAAAILASHTQILKDPLFSRDIEKKIRAYQKNAEYVLQQILEQYMNQFHSLSDPYFRERGKDIEDIGRRIMGHLTLSQRFSLAGIPPQSIVYSKDLTPSLVAEIDQDKVRALVSESGGVTSHAAIVAKAKGIPYLCSISSEALQEMMNSQVIVDANAGIMILNPLRKLVSSRNL
jgi:phosphotransferase system enzyme I (PtsI)